LIDVFDAARIGVRGKSKELCDTLGMVNGDVEADDRPIAPADNGRSLYLQKVHQRDDIGGHQIIAERRRVAGAAPVAAAIHDDHKVAFRQQAHLVAPVIRVGEAAMQQDHGLAMAEFRVPDFNTIDRRGAAVFRFRQRWSRRQALPWRRRAGRFRNAEESQENDRKEAGAHESEDEPGTKKAIPPYTASIRAFHRRSAREPRSQMIGAAVY
jgi:hypothetical protein